MSRNSRARKKRDRDAKLAAGAAGSSAGGEFDSDLYLDLVAGGGLLAASGGNYSFAGVGFTGGIGVGACNQWGGGNLLKTHQRFRTNFEAMTLKNQFSTCRGIAESNWYGSWVTDVRGMYYGAGFKFKGTKAQKWAGQNLMMNPDKVSKGDVAAVRMALVDGSSGDDDLGGVGYDFEQVVQDAVKEYVINEGVVLMWRINDDADELPHVMSVDLENVIYECVPGCYERITFSYPQNYDFRKVYNMDPVVYDDFYGKQRCRKMQTGGKYVIYKNGQGSSVDSIWKGAGDDGEVVAQEWNFVYRGKGKSGKLNVPSMISVVDDLDFIELKKVGDWNGAWKRKNVHMVAQKGTKLTSGPNAGKRLGMPTGKQLKDLSKGLSDKEGTSTISLASDTEVSYLTLASEFFGGGITEDALRRLVNWGGFATMMLMEGFSPAHGVSPYVMSQLRVEVRAARKVIVKLLYDVFNHPEFLGEDLSKTAPLLVPVFDDSVLYNGEELAKRVTQLRDSGLASVEYVRDLVGVDNDLEGDRLETEHKDRKRVTPAFEMNQGLLQAIFPEELAPKVADAVPGPKDPSKGGPGGDVGDTGGRPAKD